MNTSNYTKNIYTQKHSKLIINIIKTFFIINSLCFSSSFVFAHYPLDFGSEVRTTASLGILTSENAPSLLYNPANISKNHSILLSEEDPIFSSEMNFNFYYEQVLAYISLEYKHPNFSNLKFNLIVPPVTIGTSMNVDNFSFALLFIPTGIGSKQEIENLPIDLDYYIHERVDVGMTRTAFSLLIGGSYKYKLVTLGIAEDFSYEKEKQDIILNKNEEAKLEFNKKGSNLKTTIGLNIGDKDFGIAAKYRIRSTRTYDFSKKVSEAMKELLSKQEHSAKKYEPAVFGVGLYIKPISSLLINLEYEFEGYRKGTHITKKGWGFDPEQAYKNTHGFSISSLIKTTFLFSFPYIFNMGLSYYTGNKGIGRFGEQDGIQGISFGEIEAIPHWSIGFGVRSDVFKLLKLQSGFKYVFGSTKVDTDTPGQGEYKLRMYMLSFRFDI